MLIREGLRDVPAMKAVMGGLSDAEIVALAQHFAAQGVVAPPGPVSTRGAALAQMPVHRGA